MMANGMWEAQRHIMPTMYSKLCALSFLLVVWSSTNNNVANGKLVFTEVMINSLKASDPSTQWFEVYNTAGTSRALNNWTFHYSINNIPWKRIAIQTSKVISPYGYAVIGNNGNSVSNGGITVDIQVSIPLFPKDGSGGPHGILLFEAGATGATPHDDMLIWNANDQVRTLANFTFVPGTSLARISALAKTQDPSNWAPSTSLINCINGADKGTPGRINTYACPTKAPTKAPTNAPFVADAPMAVVPNPVAAPATAPFTAPIGVEAPFTAPIAAPVAAPVPAPASPTATKKCGLFRLGILCLNGCGILGRILGICPT